ncbi:MAG: carbon-nitrogen hydrolase family protein [Planctomycetota bacterium]|nr:MAG: carbon-nitrogen hydrolase family protein [Planctomycetota bacterium]
MGRGILKVATCQFAVRADIRRNSRRICAYLAKARRAKADIVHFSECALSGYVSVDYDTFEGYDWDGLKEEAEKIVALAGKLKLWVVLGSAHRLTEPNKPHNSLYLIGPDGEIVGRYDKRFCTEVDLENFTPGGRFVNFEINGVRCTLLICFDLRFPEIYRELKKQKVDCIFQSFYNARQKGPSVHTDIMPQTMQCRAATNYFWVSMANSSGYYSPYPSCFIQPDGKIAARLRFNRAGIMINTVDISKSFYDPSARFREMAMKGKLSNGPGPIKDPRSRNRTIL